MPFHTRVPSAALEEVAVDPNERDPAKNPLPFTDKVVNGDVVPIPIVPAKYALPVVVAPPEMVSPPFWLPLPMVEDAEIIDGTPTVSRLLC